MVYLKQGIWKAGAHDQRDDDLERTGIVLIGAALLMQRLGGGDGGDGNGHRAGIAPSGG